MNSLFEKQIKDLDKEQRNIEKSNRRYKLRNNPVYNFFLLIVEKVYSVYFKIKYRRGLKRFNQFTSDLPEEPRKTIQPTDMDHPGIYVPMQYELREKIITDENLTAYVELKEREYESD